METLIAVLIAFPVGIICGYLYGRRTEKTGKAEPASSAVRAAWSTPPEKLDADNPK